MINKIKVYLCARISKDAYEWNNHICNALEWPIRVFRPQTLDFEVKVHKHFPKHVFDSCLKAIQESDIGLVVPPYGRDCAWEIGWYGNSSKPVIFFVDWEIEWLRDWMIKGGIDYVITTNPETWSILKKDPILRFKPIILISDISKLNGSLIEIYKKHYKK